MNEADSLFIDHNQEKLRIVWIRCLLHLKEGRAKGGPPEYHLEEGDLGLFRGHARVLVVSPNDLPLPVLGGHLLHNINGDQLPEHVGQRGQLLLTLTKLDPGRMSF